MTPDQIRAAMQGLSEELNGIQASAEGFTDEQVAQVDALNDKYEAMTKQLVTAEKIEATKAKAMTTAGRKTAAPAPAAQAASGVRVEVGASGTDRFGGFKSSGEFLMAVKAAAGGKIAPQFQSVMYERNGEDGGFLVPTDISENVLRKLESNESLLAETNQTPVSGNALTLPIDESQPWNSGVQAYWTGEGQPITETKGKLTQASWRLHKIAALVKITDELQDDATALVGYINNAAPSAIMYKINSAIISGDGVAKPQGFLNSPFTVTVSKEAGQAADSIVARNVIKMYSRMLPMARARAKWLINAGAEEALLTMKDDYGNFIYLSPGSQLNQSPYALLMGRPVMPMMSGMPALGDAGDVCFADLSYYYSIVKAGGIKAASSIHLHFDREITSYRFSLRLDGSVPFKTPVTTELGNYAMSAFVKLEDRA